MRSPSDIPSTLTSPSGPSTSGGGWPALAHFFFQAEDGIRAGTVTGVQTCALPIYARPRASKSTCSDRRSTSTSLNPGLETRRRDRSEQQRDKSPAIGRFDLIGAQYSSA